MLSTWKPIWHRFLFLLLLLYMMISIASAGLGLILLLTQGSCLLLIAGTLNLVLSRVFYVHGCERYNFVRMETALMPDMGEETESLTLDPVLNSQIQRLHALEDKLAMLNDHRQDADFDPWQLQSYRHKIHQLVESDPRLEEFRRDSMENSL